MLTKKETLRLLDTINKALDQATMSLDTFAKNLETKAAEAEKEPRREAA